MDDRRAWLRKHRPDLGVGERGRLSAEAIAAYDARDEGSLTGSHTVTIEDEGSRSDNADPDILILKYPCGYCNNVWGGANHQLCPRIIHKAVLGRDAYCPCAVKAPNMHTRGM